MKFFLSIISSSMKARTYAQLNFVNWNYRNNRNSLRASSPIWGSEASLARARERAGSLRKAMYIRASHVSPYSFYLRLLLNDLKISTVISNWVYFVSYSSFFPFCVFTLFILCQSCMWARRAYFNQMFFVKGIKNILLFNLILCALLYFTRVIFIKSAPPPPPAATSIH